MAYKGKLVREDLGPGVWVLETEEGERVTLVGAVPAGLEGKRVVVEGRRASGIGIGMIGGPTVEVRSVRSEK